MYPVDMLFRKFHFKPFQICWTLAGLLLCCAVNAQSLEPTDEPLFVAGWREDVVLLPRGAKMRAKLDTGAKTSSIHAEHVERFERDGKPWVRFETWDRRRNHRQRYTVERPLSRTVKIKRHSRSPAERLVVELDFCLGRRVYTTEFTLSDRSGFNYPMLLGRRMLEHRILVDPSSTYMHKTPRKSCLKRAKRLGIPLADETRSVHAD
ncbi:MAG: ATP-dependent zinc protease family protein [Gammaproteobacteria bacterium]